MAIFIDTGVFVAALGLDKRLHKQGKKLMVAVMERKFGDVYTSEYIID
jgi:predicted nucleic acid-binding protein